MKRSGSQESRLQKLDPRLRGEEKKIKLKVCGMRNTENLAELIQVQPDFIGFIFHEASARNVTEIPDVIIPNTIKKVGVFVDKEIEFITKTATSFGLDYIQLHGNETPEFCSKLNSPLERGLRGVFKIIKAFNISADFDFEKLEAYEASCDYFLFDAFGKKSGGNGITFNWELLQKYKGQTLFLLSGGIDEKMATEIKKIQHPKFAGVDINSRFEIKAGLKDVDKIELFKKKIKI